MANSGTVLGRSQTPILGLLCLIAGVVLPGCGGSALPVESAPSTAAPPSLELANLLPVDTRVVFRLNVSRLRGSQHNEALLEIARAAIEADMAEQQPTASEGEGEASPSSEPASPSPEAPPPSAETQWRALSALMDQADTFVGAMMPARVAPDAPHHEGLDVLLLAVGNFDDTLISQLLSLEGRSHHEVVVDGHQVSLTESDEEGSVSAYCRPRPDLIVMGNEAPVRDMLPRLRMSASAARWPPRVRMLMSSMELEEATLGVVISGQAFGDAGRGRSLGFLEGGIGVGVDLDDQLNLRAMASTESPQAASVLASLLGPRLPALLPREVTGAHSSRALLEAIHLQAIGSDVVLNLQLSEQEVAEALNDLGAEIRLRAERTTPAAEEDAVGEDSVE